MSQQVIPLDEADPNIRDLFKPGANGSSNHEAIFLDTEEAEEALIARGTQGDEEYEFWGGSGQKLWEDHLKDFVKIKQ